MKKIFTKILIVLVVLVVVLFLCRNFIARKSVEVGFSKVTGFPLTIESVSLAPTLTRVEVRNLHLMNPPDFTEKHFVELPVFSVDYQLGSMVAGRPHINEMIIRIDAVTIVKNAQGESNLNRLKGVAASSSDSDSGQEEPKTKYQVDTVKIHIGKVTTKDFSKAKPSERTINLNVDATYNNITDSTDITRLVLLTMASQIHLPDFGVDTAGLKKGLGNVTTTAGKAVQGAAETLQKTGQGVFETLKKAVPQK